MLVSPDVKIINCEELRGSCKYLIITCGFAKEHAERGEICFASHLCIAESRDHLCLTRFYDVKECHAQQVVNKFC